MNAHPAPSKATAPSTLRKKLLPSLVALAAMLITNALDAAPGDIYEADAGSGNIYRITPGGTKTLFASGFSSPEAVAFDALGNLFVAESNTGTIYKVPPNGTKTTFATGLSNSYALAFDGTGTLYVAEYNAGRITKYSRTGVKGTVATGLSAVAGLAFDSSGNLFASQPSAHTILKFAGDGTMTTFTNNVKTPWGITFDAAGNLCVVDSSDAGPHLLYKFDLAGTRTTFATLPARCTGITYEGLFGSLYVAAVGSNSVIEVHKDGSQTTLASGLSSPESLAIEPVVPAPGVVYIGDDSNINVVNSNGRRSTFTGQGLVGQVYPMAFDSKGNLFAGQSTGVIKISPAAIQSGFATAVSPVTALAVDSADNVYYGDGKTIFKVTPTGTKTTFGTTTDSLLGMAVYASDNVFASTISSSEVGSIIKFTPASAQTVFATGIGRGYGMAFSASGDLYVAQYGGPILKFTPAGGKTTFTSNVDLSLYIAFDGAGNLYVSASGTVYKYAPNGFKTTLYSGNALGIAVEKPTGRPLNISTRLKVQTGDNALISGFIITGPDPKNVLIRGIGPSLAGSIPGALQDPTLELYAGATKLKTNDNWKINEPSGVSQQAAVEATSIPPGNDLESAILITIQPGAYTATLRGKNNTTGTGLVEVYDISHVENVSKLANISTRGFVDGGENLMIGGFIVADGDGYGKVIIRALGPSLAASGVTNPVGDPKVQLVNSQGQAIDSNDDWKSTNQAAIQATGIPPTNDREAAIVTTLPPGAYTAIVAGVNGTSGIALVEVYSLRQ